MRLILNKQTNRAGAVILRQKERNINMTKHTFSIKRTLQECGITPDIKGYHYLAEAIAIKERANEKNDFNKSVMSIYEEVAGKFSTTASKVERAIRHAVEKGFKINNPVIAAVFGNAINANSGKVTNACFIAMIAEYIEFPESEGSNN